MPCDAACALSLCVPVVAEHDTLDARRCPEAAQFDGDAAIKGLRDAVSKGYRDGPYTMKHTGLDPPRQREELQKLAAELEGKRR
jgi:hypothetical protein